MSERHFPDLNEFDILLMEELELDVRQTCKDLAAKLGTSRSTVNKKVRRLLDSGVLRKIYWTDPTALGYKFIVTLAISAQPGLIGDVAEKLATCKRVSVIHLCSGRFNILGWALFRKSGDVSHFLLNEIGRINGVLEFETMLTMQLVKVTPRLLTDEKEPLYPEHTASGLDDLDLKLIRELQIDARQNASHLARKFGVYKSTILRRIQKLMDEHVIRIGASIHPFALGYEGIALIGLKCDPDKVKEVAEAIATYRHAQYVGISAGRYDITTWVVFQKLSDLQHFITAELGSIPGLRDTETMISYKLVKAANGIPLSTL